MVVCGIDDAAPYRDRPHGVVFSEPKYAMAG
jgi:hypothetical protein